MAQHDKPKGTPQIAIKAEDEIAKARFCNLAHVGSSHEGLVFDFAFAQGVSGWLLSRIVMSPSHAKRFHRVLGETLLRYEEAYGRIDPGPNLQ